MTRLEELTRRLISRIDDPLEYALEQYNKEVPDSQRYEDQKYRDIISCKLIVREIRIELDEMSNKEGSSKKFKQKKLF
jgi:hypothetical protein